MKFGKHIFLLLYFFAFIFGLLRATHAQDGREQTICVQQIFSSLGYSISVDGILGSETINTSVLYLENSKLLKTGVQDELPPINIDVLPIWCNALRSAHKDVIPIVRKGHKFAKTGKYWVMESAGLPAYFHQRPEGLFQNLVILIHADSMNKKQALDWCKAREIQLQLKSFQESGLLFVCLQRPKAVKNWRRPIDIQEALQTTSIIFDIFDVPVSCLGHSGGGHLCVSLAQQTRLKFKCIVASSPVLSVYKREIVQFGSDQSVRRDLYDPVRFAIKTKTEKLIIVGDSTGKDQTVHKVAWEDFIARAKEVQVNIQYVKADGQGHATEPAATLELAECLNLNGP